MRLYVGLFLLLFVFALGVYGVGEETADVTDPSVTTSSKLPTSPSTSEPPVTTHAPTTKSTVAPPPTTTVTTTSSAAPTTVTTKPTESPTTTTTVETTTDLPTTTTIPPTESPVPDVGNWTVTEKNVTCIRAIMAVRMTIHIPSENMTLVHNLSPNATYDKSECNFTANGMEQSLVLVDGDYVLTFVFAKDSTHTFVQNISLSYTKDMQDERLGSGKYFQSSNDKSYYCVDKVDVLFENVTLVVSKAQIQAFGQKGETGYRAAEDCADGVMDNIVPIAVACVLAGMVIIILIGYLIGRRQTRPRGYQSM